MFDKLTGSLSKLRKANLVLLPVWGLITTAAVGLVYLVLHHFWAEDMMTSLHALWGKGFVATGLVHVWWLFAWAAAMPLLLSLIARQPSIHSKPRQIGVGWWTALNSGVWSEIVYRAFLPLIFMVTLRALDAVFLGFAHIHVVRGLFHYVVWAANQLTFHALAPQLLHQGFWVFGAAIVLAGIKFSEDHPYQRGFGKINLWFVSMTMFWLVFHYGLLTAIVARVLFEGIFLTMVALRSRQPRRMETMLYAMLDA